MRNTAKHETNIRKYEKSTRQTLCDTIQLRDYKVTKLQHMRRRNRKIQTGETAKCGLAKATINTMACNKFSIAVYLKHQITAIFITRKFSNKKICTLIS